MNMRRNNGYSLIMIAIVAAFPQSITAQTPTSVSTGPAAAPSSDSPVVPNSVKVVPEAPDEEIASRLEKILVATDWFQDCRVQVEEGVAFLEGQTADAKYKEWATNLAQKTDDVVAVVNRIRLTQRALWDLSPAWKQIEEMGRNMIQGLPLFGIAVVVLILTWIITGYLSAAASRAIGRRMPNPILQQVGSRALAIPAAILGIYLALRISGLTQIAATVVGGTGLIGLIVGIAFRDIAENFLASILISMQRPFQLGDLIDVNNVQGVVQSVTTRGTLLITLDGNHVQIPNSLIYKNVIYNMTANQKLRISFNYPVTAVSPEEAQRVVMQVLRGHDAVQNDPEPLVLVDELNATGLVLKVYFWIDGHAFSSVKVKSAIMRLAFGAIEQLKVERVRKSAETGQPRHTNEERNGASNRQRRESDSEDAGGKSGSIGEGGLQSEQPDLEKQAKNSARMNDCVNLLVSPDCENASKKRVNAQPDENKADSK